MMDKKKLFIGILLLVLVLIIGFYGFIFGSVYMYFQEQSEPRYEVGEYKGAAFCGKCHQEIYNQWLQNSSHADANNNPRFESYRRKITENVVTNIVIGDANCYACMGPKKVLEGVNCEGCHGLILPNISIMETHEQKFKPGLESMKKPEFCVPCHEMEDAMTVYREWQKSEASKKGIICHDCHMEKRDNISYHGFDGISRSQNVEKYRDDLNITDINLDFPRFSLAIENRLISHAIPASGPSRLLVMEISFLDSEGVETHKIVEKFAKKYNLLPIVGIMPLMLQENTQLQSGEIRHLNYTLPPELEGQISKVVLTLRFYDVSDDHAGDLSKAHWISEPILEGEVSFD